MRPNPNSYITELEAKIRILEQENELLSAKAEENLLLTRAFEGINSYEDTSVILKDILESISILLDIQFSGLFELSKNKHFRCIGSYALFKDEDTTLIDLKVSEDILRKLSANETCYVDENSREISLLYSDVNFTPHNTSIVPLNTETTENIYFVFVNDKNGPDLVNRIPLFDKITQVISAKLDKIYFQNELKKLNEVLEKKVEKRTTELVQQNEEFALLNKEYKRINEELFHAKEKAEESDRLKTAFLQNMSHEIRTPMNAIMGFSGILAENFNDKPKLDKYAEIINRRCSDLLEIINDILDLARIESGQLPINIEECDLSELFAEIDSFFKEHQQQINKQHINFNATPLCNSVVGNIATDEVKLRQIFINLIGNAFKFTEKGKIEVGCKFNNTSELLFYVSDTGIGIPSDKQDVIFERFAQAHRGGRKNFGGTGLGLSIVKGFIDLLGGNIWLDSAPSKGSTFYFSLPYRPVVLLKPKPNKDKNVAALNSNKIILVVEDDYYNVEYIQEILSSNTSFIVIATDNGEEAVQIALRQPIDVVLMDIRLPDMNGYEVTKRILEHKPDIKIIVQTAYASKEEKQKALHMGCTDYISKPLNKTLLLSLINKHLSIING